MKVAIIGGGIIGLSTAWALTRLGHKVIVLEQGAIPNPHSASFDQHRMIRPHYGGQVGYTRMVNEALGAWDLLWEDLGVSHYAATGVLAVDLGDHEWMKASQRALEATRTPFEVVDWQGIESYAPALAIRQDAWGLFTPKAGVLFADRIVTDLAKWLCRNGALLRAGCPVSSLDFTLGRLALEDGEEIEADRIIVAVGAWTNNLLPDFGARVQPVRSVVGYVEPPAELAAAWAEGPALFLITPMAHLYCLPPVRGSMLKFGGAPILRPGDPNAPINITGDDLRSIGQAFAPHLKDPKGHQVISGAGAYYAEPADKRFIVEQRGKAVVITGCGGRMFKFGALVGQRIERCLQGRFPTERLTQWARGAASA